MSNSVAVQLEFTPNPDTLKYVVNRSLLPSGSRDFTDIEQTRGQSPLAEKLFEIPKVSGVMLGTNFVTVTVADQNELETLNEQCTQFIQEYLESDQPVITGSAPQNENQKELTEVEQKIVEVLNHEIRPAVAMDGGDITFEKYDAGAVFLKMQGSCSGCPSSLMTLKMGVENRLKEVVPEIEEVIPV